MPCGHGSVWAGTQPVKISGVAPCGFDAFFVSLKRAGWVNRRPTMSLANRLLFYRRFCLCGSPGKNGIVAPAAPRSVRHPAFI